jgi:hypothetical protein
VCLLLVETVIACFLFFWTKRSPPPVKVDFLQNAGRGVLFS